MKSRRRRLIVGMAGATGIVYGVRILEMLRAEGVETHLIISKAGDLTRAYRDRPLPQGSGGSGRPRVFCRRRRSTIASGSFRTLGMIIAPCSVRTLSEIATGVTSSLLTRAADDVYLKERRRLVLLLRETPLHLGHLRSMLAVTETGGIVMPPSPPSTPGRRRSRTLWTSPPRGS